MANETKKNYTPEEIEAIKAQRAAMRAAKEPAPNPEELTVEAVAELLGISVEEFNERFTKKAEEAAVGEPVVRPVTIARKAGDTRFSDIQRRKMLIAAYNAEKKVPIAISPLYAPWVSVRMPLMLNGAYIYVPTNGAQFEIAESFADLWNERRFYLDKMIRMQQQMNNISDNVEFAPGEIQFG